MNNVYLLYGGDLNSIIKKRKEIIDKLSIDDFNISIFDMTKDLLSNAISDANSIPFLGDLRVVVIRNSYFLKSSRNKKNEDETEIDNKKESYELMDYILNPSETTVFIIEAPYETLDSKSDIVQTLKANATCIYFKELGRVEIIEDVNKFIKDNKLSLTKDAKEELIRRIVDDKDSYRSELEKLLLYLNGEVNVSLDLIKGLITENEEDPIYELSSAIEAKDSSKALSIYYNLLDHSFDPLQIEASVINRFNNLLYCKELIDSGANKDEIMEYLHISSGQAYYLKEAAENISYKKIKRVLNELSKLDIDTKVNYKYSSRTIGFELFLLKI